jgi:hypothetical protein
LRFLDCIVNRLFACRLFKHGIRHGLGLVLLILGQSFPDQRSIDRLVVDQPAFGSSASSTSSGDSA